jgi:hypothetical protein
MAPNPFSMKPALIASLAALSCLLAPTGRAQVQTPVNLSGKYQCAQVKVQGKVAPCKSAPLVLKNDGRFELRGWEGNYVVSDGWVQLSDSVVSSRAKIEPGHKIVFRYYGPHGWCEMIYERRVAELGKTSLS